MKTIDLFAGWGGFSTGAEQAGAKVLWAADHWPLAVQVHEMNHKHVKHACQDLRQADWTSLPAYDLLLASPACQGHSEAAQAARKADFGVNKHHDALRSTAWAIVDCAEVTRPKAFIMENVPQFGEWTLFPMWTAALRALGYHMRASIIRAYCGAPQRRDRLFIVGSLRGRIDIDVPETTEPGFEPCIEWSAPGWRPIADCRGEQAKIRLEAASRRFGNALVQYVTGHAGIALDEPIRTVTTKDQWCVVRGREYRPLTVREYARAMGFSESYTWPSGLARNEAIRGIGNAVCIPVARRVVERVMEAA